MKELAGQVAIVTGAASGIGRELARQLSVAGCHLALADVNDTGLKGLKEELDGACSAISIYTVDVADEHDVKKMVHDVIRDHQRISILINNAGMSISAPFQEVCLEDYCRLIDTNFWSAVYFSHYALPFLNQQEEACIVNILSQFAMLGFPNKTAYCSSKAALLGFSKALYTELYGTSVRISVVIPPAVLTSFGKGLLTTK